MLNNARMGQTTLKLGTRGSPLALIQAKMVEDALRAAHENLHIETVVIKTSGDWKPADGENRLSELQGGKGLFVREIEKALQEGSIDFAVHSMKDMPSFLPDGLALDHVLPRADARDAFICRKYASFRDLPQGATVGTSSLRRQSFLLHHRPDLNVVPLRGNVQTRIEKMDSGMVDATFLALAGLNRLGLTGDFIHPVVMDDMLPACGQGIVTVETRRKDERTRYILDAIHHGKTGICAAAERAALQVLDGSCHTPIGAQAMVEENGMLSFRLMVGAADGSLIFTARGEEFCQDSPAALAFGARLARDLKQKLPDGFLL